MMGQRQVIPEWEDDPVKIQGVNWWKGYQGRRELTPTEGHLTA